MPENERPSLDVFFSDPKHQRDRDFLQGIVDRTVTQRMSEAAERAKQNKPTDSVWDKLIALLTPAKSGNLFDDIFG